MGRRDRARLAGVECADRGVDPHSLRLHQHSRYGIPTPQAVKEWIRRAAGAVSELHGAGLQPLDPPPIRSNLGLRPKLVSERAFSALHADLNFVSRAEGPIHTSLAQRARYRSGT